MSTPEITREEAHSVCSEILDRLHPVLTRTYNEWRRGGSISSPDEYHWILEGHLRQVDAAARITRMIRKPFGFFLQLHTYQFTFTVSQDAVSYHERF